MSTNDESLTPQDEALRRRTAADQKQVPIDSPGPRSGTGTAGAPLPESRGVLEDCPGKDCGR